jgi:hyperosmotically inducible periplasmic protein
MKRVLQRLVRALVVSGIATAVPLFAQADNTKANAGDHAKGAVTADQQKEDPTDRALTQKIRKALMHDKTLSTYAHNIKIVSQEGVAHAVTETNSST